MKKWVADTQQRKGRLADRQAIEVVSDEQSAVIRLVSIDEAVEGVEDLTTMAGGVP